MSGDYFIGAVIAGVALYFLVTLVIGIWEDDGKPWWQGVLWLLGLFIVFALFIGLLNLIAKG